MDYTHPTIGQTLLIALVGFTVVFMVLVVLMVLITIMSKLLTGGKKVAAEPLSVTAAPPATPAPRPPPPGLKLENVSEKEAAMLMAIVADQLQKDPAELSFISIKEVKE